MLKIPGNYYKNDVIYTSISPDPQNGSLACGFLHRTGLQHHDLCFSHYGGVYILNGKGTYEDSTGKKYTLYAGDYLQRLPNVRHRTCTCDSDDWLEFFIVFGADTYETLANLNLLSRNPVIHPGHSSFLFNKCTYLLNHMKEHHQDQPVLCYLQLQELAVDIYQRSLFKQMEPGMQRIVAQAAEMLCAPPDFLSPHEVAAALDIDYDYFRKKFKIFYNISPSAYQLNGRINYSKTLLLTTNKTLEEIAYLCHFSDAYAFSKAFKKQYGISPSIFRQMHMM